MIGKMLGIEDQGMEESPSPTKSGPRGSNLPEHQ